MTSQTPGNYVYSLDFAIGVASPQPYQLGGGQSCFAVSGSLAEARNLHQRWRAVPVSEDQGLVFVHNSGSIQQNTGVVYAAASAAVRSSGHVPADIRDRTVLGHGCVAPDTHQSVVPAAIESRRISEFPSPHTNQIRITPPSPIALSTLDSSPSNTIPSFFGRSVGSLSRSPIAIEYRPGPSHSGGDIETTAILPISPLIPSKRESDDTQDIEMGPSSGPIPRQRRPKLQRQNSLMTILRELQNLKYTAIDLLVTIIDGKEDFAGFRNALFSPRNRAKLVGLLEKLIQDDKGRPILSEWMFPHALRLVCDRIHIEMEAAKPYLRMNTSDVSPEFIEQWDIHRIMGPVAHYTTPTLKAILVAAGESKASSSKPESRNRFTAMLLIMAQIHFLRSRNSAKVPIGLGLNAWVCGTSSQMVEVLHQSCLTVSYPNITTMVQNLADRSIERAKAASLLPHALTYDNVNISSSIFAELGPNTTSRVQSGTFAVVYELFNARAEDMDIKPLIKNLRRSSPLVFSDLRMTPCARLSYVSQTAVTIVHILTRHVKGFEKQVFDAMLQHPPRRRLPPGHKTIFHTLPASTIEEASIDGNLLVHDDIYLDQLKRSPEDLNKMAIPTFNDQLTNARIRGGQHIRQKDASHWERCEIFQLAFGSFHLTMNLLWCILETHRGSRNQTGSLSHLFAILEKTRLGREKPDYHTLLSALTQILHGLMLNAWCAECGYSSLDDFAKANPSPQDLLDCAHRILEKYAVPGSTTAPSNSKAPPKDLHSGVGLSNPPTPTDVVHNNIALLTRDLLYVVELVDAIATGDFGRIEDILPSIACMFRGSGSNNYAMEILHLIFNIKEDLITPFHQSDIIRDNMLVNPSGIPGYAMGIDMNIEHLVQDLKSLFAAKGMYSNWDRLGNMTASINHLRLVKNQVSNSLKLGYHGSAHTDPSALVWRIADKVNELELQRVIPDRVANSTARPVVDIITAGYRKFQTSSLATFNKKIADMKQGKSSQPEPDEIAPCQVVERLDADDSPRELSALHED